MRTIMTNFVGQGPEVRLSDFQAFQREKLQNRFVAAKSIT